MPDLPLSGRVAIVTGANHGIGAATAAELARLGADVVVAYLAYTPADHDPGRPAEYRAQREQGPEVAVAAVEAAGRRVHPVQGDLADADAPGQVFVEAAMALGPVSILVNNASGWRKDTFAHRCGDTALVGAASSASPLAGPWVSPVKCPTAQPRRPWRTTR